MLMPVFAPAPMSMSASYDIAQIFIDIATKISQTKGLRMGSNLANFLQRLFKLFRVNLHGKGALQLTIGTE